MSVQTSERDVRGTYSNTYPPKSSVTQYGIHIDYLQYSTFNVPSDVLKLEPISPIFMYKQGFRDDNGVRYYKGNPNSGRWLVILSGKALTKVSNELPVLELLEMEFERGAKVSRLDLAMDIVRGEDDEQFITVDTIREHYQEGRIISKYAKHGAKQISGIDDDIHAETLYIGDMQKRAKLGIFRAYDKGHELDLDRYKITRLEVEEKRKSAHGLAKALLKNDMTGLFRSKFDINDEYWNNLMSSPPIEIFRGEEDDKTEEEKRDKRWQWLFEQVAPALGKLAGEEAFRGDTSKLDMFNAIASAEYHKTIAQLKRLEGKK